jgi:hypothetical protein
MAKSIIIHVVNINIYNTAGCLSQQIQSSYYTLDISVKWEWHSKDKSYVKCNKKLINTLPIIKIVFTSYQERV